MKINRFMGFVLALATLAGSNVLAAVTYSGDRRKSGHRLEGELPALW